MSVIVPHIAAIERSGIREIMGLAFAKESVVRLEVGEPDFDTPGHIVEAGCEALRGGQTRYIQNAGLLPLRRAAARFFESYTGTPTSADNILVTHGAILSLATAWHLFVEAGDEVLIPDPGWPNYTMLTRLLRAHPRYYQLTPESGFQPDLDQISSLVTPKTKMIILCSPSNPTGQITRRELTAGILDIARKHDIQVVSDEIYSNIVFDGEHNSALPHDTDNRTTLIHGVSKTYAMTGFRVGFTRATPEYVEQAGKMQETLVSCGVGASQAAALAALEGPQDCVRQMQAAYRRRRDYACAELERHGLTHWRPQGAFYIMVDVSASGLDGRRFALKLIEEKDVSVAPGPTFGKLSRDFIRISLASSEADLGEGIGRIADMVAAYEQLPKAG